MTKDLTPSQTAGLHGLKVRGICTELGGPNSHMAILARALKEKGVEVSIIDVAIEQSETDWYELVEQVRSKKFKGQVPLTWEEKGKQRQFLDYRGFTQEQIESCIE